MAATRLPPFDPAPLARFLVTAAGARSVEITGLELLQGGAIQQNWGFAAVFAGGPLAGARQLVLRCDAATGIPSSLGRIEEFAVLRAAHAGGAMVPEPLFACADPSVIGKPFFVMRRLLGTAQGRQITTDPALEEGLPQIAYSLGRQLALLQKIQPPRSDLRFLRLIEAPQHIADFRAYLDQHPQPRPVLEWAIRWLETHQPEPLPPVLCHRDFRTGNYLLAFTTTRGASSAGSTRGSHEMAGSSPAMTRGSVAEPGSPQLTGILDWEFAGWGDPDEDIGWFCCKGWRFARLDREAGGIADRAPFYRGYEHAAGRRLDPERVRFWEVLANVRWAVIALQQSDRHLIGGARDLSTAIIGRRASECELELLLLLDPLPNPSPLAGEGGVQVPTSAAPQSAWRDRPGGVGLLALGRELLIEELLPLLPPQRERELRLVATAMAIAEREAGAGAGWTDDILQRLAGIYEGTGDRLMHPLAADLRTGAFESCAARAAAARAILWRLTICKLRESNPQFLAANGIGD